MNVVKFPYSTSRRVYSRRPRWSKHGTPEERAAKAAAGGAVPQIAHAIDDEGRNQGASQANRGRAKSAGQRNQMDRPAENLRLCFLREAASGFDGLAAHRRS
jgi:hypothetical protein